MQIETKFVREDRYIVIKHSDLTDAELDHIDAFGFPQREAVVVEADWPEYEAVWGMIEARFAAGTGEGALTHCLPESLR